MAGAVVTAGSVFAAAGQLVVAVLEDELPGWNVVYEFPRSEAELVTDTGEMRVVWVEPEGESSFERTSLGRRGLTERCDLTIVFHRLVTRTGDPAVNVDVEVAEAAGSLVELMCADTPGWVVPDGWDSIEFQPSSTTRSGGYLTSVDGVGRRLEFTLSVTASRC